jgi:catechol 2,3-dioxygenase
MTSPWIQSLRSVALEVPDLAAAEAFYTGTWRLVVADRRPGALYLRGSGPDAHLLALHEAPATRIRAVTLRARDAAALPAVAQAAVAAGGRVISGPAPLPEDPAGGLGVTVRDPDGRLYQVVHGDRPAAPLPADPGAERDRPVRLAHAVLNAHDVPLAQGFLQQALGFRLADRTRIMAFMNCDRDHHSLAFGDTDNDALNHIAFLMPSLDAVMRGGGRMKDAGFPIEWGPGRHGPGDNAFNYFIGPFGEVIEYTAEVEQIDAHYTVGGPDDWTWPPGRVDQWGISAPPSARLKAAQRAVFFMPTP